MMIVSEVRRVAARYISSGILGFVDRTGSLGNFERFRAILRGKSECVPKNPKLEIRELGRFFEKSQRWDNILKKDFFPRCTIVPRSNCYHRKQGTEVYWYLFIWVYFCCYSSEQISMHSVLQRDNFQCFIEIVFWKIVIRHSDFDIIIFQETVLFCKFWYIFFGMMHIHRW